MADDEMVTVSRDDLHALVDACQRYLPDVVSSGVQMAFGRLYDACHEVPALEAEPLPDGIFGRCELPGYRQHTGWITEETVFGLQMAVIRDWDGRVVAEVALGPGSQIVHLPTPLKRPEPRAALTAGPWRDHDPDEDLADDDPDDGYDRDFDGPVL